MMKKPFFIMLYNQTGDAAEPIVDEEGEMMFWATKDEAEAMMRGHMFAEAFGFEVHVLGGCTGVTHND